MWALAWGCTINMLGMSTNQGKRSRIGVAKKVVVVDRTHCGPWTPLLAGILADMDGLIRRGKGHLSLGKGLVDVRKLDLCC